MIEEKSFGLLKRHINNRRKRRRNIKYDLIANWSRFVHHYYCSVAAWIIALELNETS